MNLATCCSKDLNWALEAQWSASLLVQTLQPSSGIMETSTQRIYLSQAENECVSHCDLTGLHAIKRILWVPLRAHVSGLTRSRDIQPVSTAATWFLSRDDNDRGLCLKALEDLRIKERNLSASCTFHVSSPWSRCRVEMNTNLRLMLNSVKKRSIKSDAVQTFGRSTETSGSADSPWLLSVEWLLRLSVGSLSSFCPLDPRQ